MSLKHCLCHFKGHLQFLYLSIHPHLTILLWAPHAHALLFHHDVTHTLNSDQTLILNSTLIIATATTTIVDRFVVGSMVHHL